MTKMTVKNMIGNVLESPSFNKYVIYLVFCAVWWYDDHHMTKITGRKIIFNFIESHSFQKIYNMLSHLSCMMIWWASYYSMMIIIWIYSDHFMTKLTGKNMLFDVLESLLFKNIASAGSFVLYDSMMLIIWKYDDHHMRTWWRWHILGSYPQRLYGLYGLSYII